MLLWLGEKELGCRTGDGLYMETEYIHTNVFVYGKWLKLEGQLEGKNQTQNLFRVPLTSAFMILRDLGVNNTFNGSYTFYSKYMIYR